MSQGNFTPQTLSLGGEFLLEPFLLEQPPDCKRKMPPQINLLLALCDTSAAVLRRHIKGPSLVLFF